MCFRAHERRLTGKTTLKGSCCPSALTTGSPRPLRWIHVRLPAVIPIGSKGDLIVRAVWLLLAAIHISPLLRVGGAMLGGELEAARWISLIALALSLAFFALKTAGVAFLRVRCRWTALLLFLVACGLLHGNATPGAWLEKTGYTAIAMTTAAGASELVSRRSRRRTWEWLKRLQSALASQWAAIHPCIDVLDECAAALWRRLLAASHGPPRAPPA